MKKILSIILAVIMIIGSASTISATENAESFAFTDDFETASDAWRLDGAVLKDGKLIFDAQGLQYAYLEKEGMALDRAYAIEYDVTVLSEPVKNNENWIGFNAGGAMFFFRVYNKTVHGYVKSEAEIGKATLEKGKTYRIRAEVRDGYVLVFYKGAADEQFKEIGAYARENTLNNQLFNILTRNMKSSADNFTLEWLNEEKEEEIQTEDNNVKITSSKEKIVFNEDFRTEATSWTLEGAKWIDDKLVFDTTNMQSATLGNKEFRFYNPYTVEFDFKILSDVYENQENWIGFNAGGATFFFRLFRGTVHGYVTGESQIGQIKFEKNKNYRMKVAVGDGYVVLLYKGEKDSSYREIGVYTKEDTLGQPFRITARVIKYEVDNVTFKTSGGRISANEKVMELEVGSKKKIELTGSRSSGAIFESTNPDVATVAEDGTVEALKAGSSIINIKSADGSAEESVFVRTSILPATVRFDYDPVRTGNIPKDSEKFDYENIILTVGEKCDLRAEIPGNTTLKGIEWSVDKEGIVELYGSYNSAPTRAITALSPGEVIVQAKSRYNDARAKIKVKVISDAETEQTQSNTYRFIKTGEKHSMNKNIVGSHVMSHQLAELKADGKTFFDVGGLMDEIGINSMRSGSEFIKDSYLTEGETKTTRSFKIAKEHQNLMYIFDFSLGDLIKTPDDYDEAIEKMVAQVLEIKEYYDGPLYLELFNETYAISFQEQFPKIEDYVEFCKRAVTEIKKVAPEAIFMAVGMYYASYMDITYDPGNFVATGEGDPAFTQGYRVQHWNERVKELVDGGYVQGITLHPYQGCGSNMNGMTAQNLIRAKLATVDMNYFGSLWDARSFDYKADFYFTEWGQLQGLIYWGAAARDDEEKKRYNLQKYPASALCNMKSMLTFMKVGNVQASQMHHFCGSDGFGIIDEQENVQEYKIPNRIVFEKTSDIFDTSDTFYDISPVNMNFVTIARPWWNGGEAEQLHVADVEAYGFGTADELKEVAFFNQTDVPQKVKLDGAMLKPTWSYGGDAEKILPDWLKNSSWTSWAPTTISLSDSDAYTWLPDLHEGASAAEEIEIPPYTIMFASVMGTPQTDVVTAENTISRLASYAFRNSLILGINESKAYVDNIEKSIDESAAVVPVIENGRTLLPLRFVAENMDCSVDFDDVTRVITVKSKTAEVKFTLDETAYSVNGEEKQLDIAPVVRDGRTLIPVRALSEALGHDVYWDDRGFVFISKKTCTVDVDIKYYFDEISKLYR